jgi:hypothetical protein
MPTNKQNSLFELLDRTHIASQLIQTALSDHPALDDYPLWRADVAGIVADLEFLYQAIGKELSGPPTTH